jgi:hypothetical protein
MGLSREEVEKIGQETAQRVLEALHRYTITYEEPRSIEQGIRDSMVEESTAANWYRRRAIDARPKHDTVTADLYEHIAKEEDQHYQEFQQRLKALKHEVTSLTPEGASTYQFIEHRSGIGKLARAPKGAIEKAIDAVPDVKDPGKINYWQTIGDEEIYLEGWSDKCLAGTGFPTMERGGTFEKIAYMQDMTPEILVRKAKERGLEFVEGGFIEREPADNLYGVTYGVYRKPLARAKAGMSEVTEKEARYGFLQLSEAEYGEALKSGRYPEPTRYEKLTGYFTKPHEPG